MFSSFKRQQKSSALQKPLLDEDEFHQLRLLAEQIDCSSISDKTLYSCHTGNLATRALGSGLDYAESRVYQAGDDLRSINWRLSARSQETFVKTYHVESRPSLCIVLDQRSSMMFGTRTRLKFVQALRLATVLAFAAEQQRLQLKVILLNYLSERLEVNNAEDLLAELNNNGMLQIDDQFVDSRDNIDCALKRINESLEKGSLVYFISDFAGLNKDHQKQFFQLQANHFVQALHVIDPAELNIENTGGVLLQDMLTNALLMLGDDQNSEMNLNHALQQYNDKIKQTLLESAVYYSLVSTTDDALDSKIMFPLAN